MNNSKDIPFALGMIVSAYYLLRIVQVAPVIRKVHFAGLFLGLFLTFSIRIGGVLFAAYSMLALLYLWKRFRASHKFYPRKLTTGLALSGTGAFLLSLLFLPGVWHNIVLDSAKAVHRFSNYSIALTMLYQGKDIPTISPPWHYLPVWIGITIPVVVLLLFGAGVFFVFRKNRFPEWLLLSMVLLPVLFVILNRSAVYDSWRQYYFIYPPLVVLAGIAAARLYAVAEHPALRIILPILLLAGLALPVIWSFRNHPLEHVYFNELTGGIKGAHGNFETDYYGDGLELASRKLIQHLAIHPERDSIVIAENVPTQLRYYLEKSKTKASFHHTAYERRDSLSWDYGIFATRGIDTFWKRSDWPPADMIDSVTADGILLIAIVKNNRR